MPNRKMKTLRTKRIALIVKFKRRKMKLSLKMLVISKNRVRLILDRKHNQKTFKS